ncbi:MAG TPA: FtsX-like permease family protein [Prolixibacteraceae bacterium]|nr:FtsX-like permease family protein [Prolixibacteraceae bacterium]
MKEYIKLAWRNIWRNKRRTLITAASIFFAVLIAILMRSFQLGSYDNMIDNFVESYSGYIQVQHNDFWEKKSINNTIEYTDSLRENIENHNNVEAVFPRLEAFALASSGNSTKGAIVMGIIPEKENEMTRAADKIVKYRLTDAVIDSLERNQNLPAELMDRIKESRDKSFTGEENLSLHLQLDDFDNATNYLSIITSYAQFKGEYIKAGEKAVLVADKLAKYLNLTVGDTLILISQGFHGISASGLFPVKGIISLPNPELNRSFIYMPLATAQDFYSAINRITSLAINVKDNDYKQIVQTRDAIKSGLNKTEFAVMDWKEMNPELVQQIESDNISGQMMLGILYLIIAFGIFSTVLMMTAERQREFGVMIAIGMQKIKLAAIVVIELIFIGFIGIISGMLASIPGILFGHANPIRLTGEMAESMESFGMEAVMPFALIDTYFFNQGLVVIVIILLVIIYPVYSITNIKEVDALRA